MTNKLAGRCRRNVPEHQIETSSVSIDRTRPCTCIHQTKNTQARIHATFKVLRAFSYCCRYWKFHNEYHHQHVHYITYIPTHSPPPLYPTLDVTHCHWMYPGQYPGQYLGQYLGQLTDVYCWSRWCGDKPVDPDE